MTVAELIAKLQQMPPDLEVMVLDWPLTEAEVHEHSTGYREVVIQ